ncbi:hypothetical protein B0I27_10263 [Arcticibacter pallidicorallinus]|uniref:YceK/YidQ family lipoprotein n=1 Tax=Arcticibacter pallidicorallinus TaxID=1259464 RepID=A0A2T0U8Y5_9SPHI|nr:hypothetical protein [Arcticibacter pallidicorallinus]PRY54297.1 hypothetical protein B0I27_10263 [Arcticibacter pallidicorallinus]
MKKFLSKSLVAVLLCCTFSSCATIFGGPVTQAQRTKPLPGEASRPIRAVALIADILLFWPGAVVDFATGAIYKPDGAAKIQKSDEKKESSASAGASNNLN